MRSKSDIWSRPRGNNSIQQQKSGNCPLRGASRNIRASLGAVICREKTAFDWTVLMVDVGWSHVFRIGNVRPWKYCIHCAMDGDYSAIFNSIDSILDVVWTSCLLQQWQPYKDHSFRIVTTSIQYWLCKYTTTRQTPCAYTATPFQQPRQSASSVLPFSQVRTLQATTPRIPNENTPMT